MAKLLQKIMVHSLLFALGAFPVLLLSWALAVFLYVQYAVNLQAEGQQRLALMMTQKANPADRIVVLTGGGGRLEAGITLLEQKAAPRLLITGVAQGVRLEDILPDLPNALECCISMGHQAVDTLGNAAETRQWLVNQDIFDTAETTIVLVSAHYHLPRALLQFQQTMPQTQWIGYAVEPEDLPLAQWYQYGRGWRIFSIELLKFLWVGALG